MCLAASEAYASVLTGFGGVTPPLPTMASASGIFSWMSANFCKLPDFVGKVMDFAVLSSMTNLAMTLVSSGCEHLEDLKRKQDFRKPAELGETPRVISSSVRHFMQHFWCKFGREDARAVAEA